VGIVLRGNEQARAPVRHCMYSGNIIIIMKVNLLNEFGEITENSRTPI